MAKGTKANNTPDYKDLDEGDILNLMNSGSTLTGQTVSSTMGIYETTTEGHQKLTGAVD